MSNLLVNFDFFEFQKNEPLDLKTQLFSASLEAWKATLKSEYTEAKCKIISTLGEYLLAFPGWKDRGWDVYVVALPYKRFRCSAPTVGTIKYTSSKPDIEDVANKLANLFLERSKRDDMEIYFILSEYNLLWGCQSDKRWMDKTGLEPYFGHMFFDKNTKEKIVSTEED